MDDTLRGLYQEILLDHYRAPRRQGTLPSPTASLRETNPLCGDDVTVDVRIGPGGRIADIRFRGKGCSICIASASMMSEGVAGQSAAAVRALTEEVKRLTKGEPRKDKTDLDDLEALGGVSKFPVRIKCALLPWMTLEKLLGGLPKAAAEETS